MHLGDFPQISHRTAPRTKRNETGEGHWVIYYYSLLSSSLVPIFAGGVRRVRGFKEPSIERNSIQVDAVEIIAVIDDVRDE